MAKKLKRKQKGGFWYFKWDEQKGELKATRRRKPGELDDRFFCQFARMYVDGALWSPPTKISHAARVADRLHRLFDYDVSEEDVLTLCKVIETKGKGEIDMTKYAKDQLELMTQKALYALAKREGIPCKSKDKKADLVTVLEGTEVGGGKEAKAKAKAKAKPAPKKKKIIKKKTVRKAAAKKISKLKLRNL